MAHAERSGKAWVSLAYRRKNKKLEESGHANLNIFSETRKPMSTKKNTHTHNMRAVISVLFGTYWLSTMAWETAPSEKIATQAPEFRRKTYHSEQNYMTFENQLPAFNWVLVEMGHIIMWSDCASGMSIRKPIILSWPCYIIKTDRHTSSPS